MILRPLALIALGLTTSGCLFLPIPHRTHDAPGVRGQVVAADTGEPIPGAEILDLERPDENAVTDASGAFALDDVRPWHGAVFALGSMHPIWPHTQCSFQAWRRLRIVASGYEPTEVAILEESLPRDLVSGVEERIAALGEDEGFAIAPVALRRIAPAAGGGTRSSSAAP